MRSAGGLGEKDADAIPLVSGRRLLLVWTSRMAPASMNPQPVYPREQWGSKAPNVAPPSISNNTPAGATITCCL